jgi:hypothetical protein
VDCHVEKSKAIKLGHETCRFRPPLEHDRHNWNEAESDVKRIPREFFNRSLTYEKVPERSKIQSLRITLDCLHQFEIGIPDASGSEKSPPK